jgi:ribosomal protein S18 acetylase RimI-like enzyme
MTDTTIRDVSADDAGAVLDLVVLCDIAELGEPDYALDDIEADLARTTHRGWVAVDPDGALQGYAWVELRANHTSITADVMVRPGGDRGLLQPLLDRVLDSAREIDPTLTTHLWGLATDRAKARLFEAAGASVVRHFWRMKIELPDSPAPVVPPLPDGVVIRVADGGEADLRAVHSVIDTAFLEHFAHQASAYEDWATTHTVGSSNDYTLWWIATVDGELAAAQIANGTPVESGGYIADLGTLPAYRGRGLGRALLLTAFAEFHRRGLRTVSLGVDSSNATGAAGLYESVGMTVRNDFATYEFPPAR